MEKLTILEQESLEILKQLQFYCDSALMRDIKVKQEIIKKPFDSYNDDIKSYNLSKLKERKFLGIPYVAIDFTTLKKHMDIHDVEKYLQNNDVNFHVTLDFIFDDPTRLEASSDPLAIYEEVGIINGESVQEIKNKIEKLIYKLDSKKSNMRKEVKNTNMIFYFNKSNGELSLYPKEMNKTCSFTINAGRYKIIVQLIEEKNIDDNFYISTDKITQECGYKNNQKCRESIHAIREKIEKTFKKISGNEFIEVKQPDGYRIGKKISVFFEDTP